MVTTIYALLMAAGKGLSGGKIMGGNLSIWEREEDNDSGIDTGT